MHVVPKSLHEKLHVSLHVRILVVYICNYINSMTPIKLLAAWLL